MENLNGEWDFSFDFGKSGVDRCFYEKKDWEKKIIVPFCPKSDLSGIGYKDYMDAVWYHKTVELTEVEVKDAFCCILARWIMIRAYGSTEQRLDGIKAVIPLLHSISRLMRTGRCKRYRRIRRGRFEKRQTAPWQTEWALLFPWL